MSTPDNHIPSRDEILQYLSGFEQEGGERWRKENERYLHSHALRLQKTLAVILGSKQGTKLLELGAAPYFFTLLLEHYTDYSITLANGVMANNPKQASIKLVKNSSGEEVTYMYQTFNAEQDHYPYPDNSFDLVLCCELLEHLILDPTHMLLEIHRVLIPGGRVLITTPNVLVLRNIIALLINRRNIYYPYSGYGVYGRHNREWTQEELVQLVSGCGYHIEINKTVDTYPHRGYSRLLKTLIPSLRDMLIVLARSVDEPQEYYPDNLYESLPEQYSHESLFSNSLKGYR